MTKTTTDKPTLAEIRERQGPNAEHEAFVQRTQPSGPGVGLDSPYLQQRISKHDRTIIGYPPGPNGHLTPADRPEFKSKGPRELPDQFDRTGVGRALAGLAVLGIPAPKGAPEAFARAVDVRSRAKSESQAIAGEMRSPRSLRRSTAPGPDGQLVEVREWVNDRNADLAAVRDDIAARLSSGEIGQDEARQLLARVGTDTAEQARRAVWRRFQKDALAYYREAWQAFRDDGPRLIADLHTLAVETVAAQAKSARPLDDLGERWDLIHDTAEDLRKFAVTSLAASSYDWRYARPDLAHAWRVQHDERMHAYQSIRLTPTVTMALHRHVPPNLPDVAEPDEVANRQLERERLRYPLTLTAAARNPEWGGGCYTAEQVHDRIHEIARAQGQPGRW